MYQPPPQNAVAVRPRSWSHRPSRRTRSAGSPPVGRAWSGAVQCVWRPSGPRTAAARARSSQKRSSSPASASGGRIRAAIRNPPGRRSCRALNRRQTSSSSGRSTWQETTAYLPPGKMSSVCGIAGLYSPGDAPNPELVDAMRAAIVHRGPDDGSTDAFGACVLGHQRLKIVDLETGYQPVANETGDVVCVFNGELYNLPELRDELGGHEVRGTGDTPVLPHLYEEHGPSFVERLHGMLALALWDAPRNRLVLARDRLGKKPLLWTRLPDGTLAFASELKALLQLPVERTLDLAAIDAYLALGYVPGERTGIAGVRRLPPGHLLVVEDGRERLERYWRLESHDETLSDDEWLERVRETVRAAVRRRLVADVPLGVLLSGGIDSSIVTALMAEAASDPVRTFTVGFDDAAYDERGWARLVAERYGTRHEEVVLDADVAGTLERLVRTFDEPLGDEAILPLYLICEAARTHVTVALTGDGGDEAFGGYERYAAMGLAARTPRAA